MFCGWEKVDVAGLTTSGLPRADLAARLAPTNRHAERPPCLQSSQLSSP